MKNRTRALPGAAWLVAVAGAAGCTTTTVTTGYTQITGIKVRSTALVAGYGCGVGPDQVYRYAAVVSRASDGGSTGLACPAAAGAQQDTWVDVFDCFTDGVFENLPTTAHGGLEAFAVSIYAYSKSAYTSSGLPASLQCPDGSSCIAQDPCSVLAAAPSAPWTTTCTATQQQGVPVLAVCAPLMSQGSGGDGGAGSETGAQTLDGSGGADGQDATAASDGTAADGTD